MGKIRVLVADDHPIVREGLCRLLCDEEDIDVVAQATDGEEAVGLAKDLLPDIAILDIGMPGNVDGIEAARQIKSACPNTSILILSVYDYEAYILASLQAGATGYLLKKDSLSKLVSIVRLVNDGETVISSATSKSLHHLMNGNKKTKNSGRLQQREIDVLKFTARGLSNRDIAESLFVSERTVQSHLANIFKKLNVGSRTEAVLLALKEGWLDLSDLPQRKAHGDHFP